MRYQLARISLAIILERCRAQNKSWLPIGLPQSAQLRAKLSGSLCRNARPGGNRRSSRLRFHLAHRASFHRRRLSSGDDAGGRRNCRAHQARRDRHLCSARAVSASVETCRGCRGRRRDLGRTHPARHRAGLPSGRVRRIRRPARAAPRPHPRDAGNPEAGVEAASASIFTASIFIFTMSASCRSLSASHIRNCYGA